MTTPCENFEINITETPDEVTVNVSSIGEKGDKGVKGDTGISGTAVYQGATGVQGDTGLGNTGITGATGIQGATGVKGDTGLGDTGITGSTGITGAGGALAYYGDFTDTTTQTNLDLTSGNPFTFNTEEEANGVSIVDGSKMTFPHAGTYLINFSAQITKTSGGTDLVYIWATKNGTALPDTAGQITLQGSDAGAIRAWSYIVTLIDNDNLELWWHSADSTVIMKAIPSSTPGIPDVPSASISAQQVMYTIEGATGITGGTGIQGSTGAHGDTGIQGSTGVTGATGATGIQGDTGIQGSTGTPSTVQGNTGIQGATGIEGATGIQGTLGGFSIIYTFETETVVDPSLGCIRLNHATPGLATFMYVSETDKYSNGVDAFLDTLQVGDMIRIFHTLDLAEYAIYEVAGTFTSAGTYDPIPVTYVTGSGALLDGMELGLSTAVKGDRGDKGDTGVQGDTGITGGTGIQGNTGIQGDTGIQGNTGVYGNTGIQGGTGIQGSTTRVSLEVQVFRGILESKGIRVSKEIRV
jgi:hypothetical protein